MAKELNENEVEESLQRYRQYTDQNKEELDRIKGYTDELTHRMQAAEEERQKVEAAHKRLSQRRGSSARHYDLPYSLTYEQLQEELEWTRQRMDVIIVRLQEMERQEAAEAAAREAAAAAEAAAIEAQAQYERQDSHLYEHVQVDKHVQNGAEPPPDYDTQTLEPLSREETENAVAMIEVMKQDGKLDSAENKAMLTEIVNNLETDTTDPGVPMRKSKKDKKMKEQLALLQEDLAANRDQTSLTEEELSMLQYQLKSGKYMTRTLKQIRQGNTKNRVSLFEQL